MGGLTLSLDFQGGGLSGLDELLARLDNLSPALERAGGLMVASVMRNFASQGRPEPWQPLSPETIRRKGNDIILFDTGRLMGSIGCDAGRDYASITAGAPYAGYVQDSGRAFLLFQDEDIPAIMSLIEDYLT